MVAKKGDIVMFSASRRILTTLKVLGVLWYTVGTAVCQANLIFDVSFPSWPGTFTTGTSVSLLFELTDGSGLDDGNNTITISNFDFGGGVAGSATTTGGGATSTSPLAVLLTDTVFDNTVLLPFTTGSSLKFSINLTTNDDGIQLDQFSLFILDDQGNALVTSDTLASAFLVLDIGTGVSLSNIQTFSNDTGPSVGEPLITTPVPEPSSLILLVSSLVGLMWIQRSNRKIVASKLDRAN